MKIFYNLPSDDHHIDSITIGFFDGCHRGHRYLFSTLSSFQDRSGIITFDSHPKSVINPPAPSLITSTKERLRLLQNLPIHSLYVLPFTQEFANQSSEDFLCLLHKKLHFRRIIWGYDSKIGKGGTGTPETLQPLAQQLGIEIIKVPPYRIQEEIVSSNRIRQLLMQGQLELANSLLGYDYRYIGKVEKGLGIGTQLGIPTINLALEQPLLPKGVYSCVVEHNYESYLGVMNLGEAPTIRGSLCLEAHLIDFSGDLNKEEVIITPKKFLREEQRFSSKEELVSAISEDIAKTKKLFNYVRTT